MSLLSALSVALSGLQVTTAQLQIAASNISNAQQPGYTEKTAVLSPLSSGADDRGVTISGYTRATNTGLTTAYNSASSEAGFLSSQNNYMQQVQSILGANSSNPGLSDAIAQFQSAWTQFSAAPESQAQQQAVIQAGSNLAAQIVTTSQNVTALSKQVQSDTAGTVTTLNSYLSQIVGINQQIADSTGTGQDTGNLEDQRDQLINKISTITQVTVIPRADDQIALYTPQGQPLLDRSAQVFTYDGTNIMSSSGQIVTNNLTGGSLQAEIQFNYNGSPAAVSTQPGSEVIRKLNSQLQALTTALTGTTGTPPSFASAYNSAAAASGELASGFFTVTTNAGVPDPNSLAVNANLLNGSATLKQASAAPVVTALSASRTFTADGLNATGTYANLGTTILSGFQQAANTISTQNTTAASQQTYYQQALSNATGVNVDSELVQLTTLQNSYAASAHVITTVNQMLQELTSILG